MIEVEGLGLRIGREWRLEGVSFRVEPGECLALFGRNGSGKSLLLRLLATELRPDAGSGRIAGYDLARERRRVREAIGFLGEPVSPLPHVTATDYLVFFAAGHRIRGAERWAAIADVLDLTDLTVHAERRVETLSRGERARLELARVLLHDPSVLLLDEPLDGLDPLGRVEMREVLAELKAMGKTLLLATHTPERYGDIPDRGLLLDAGRVVFDGDLDAFCAPFPEIDPPNWEAALLRRLAALRDNAVDVSAEEEIERSREGNDDE